MQAVDFSAPQLLISQDVGVHGCTGGLMAFPHMDALQVGIAGCCIFYIYIFLHSLLNFRETQ